MNSKEDLIAAANEAISWWADNGDCEIFGSRVFSETPMFVHIARKALEEVRAEKEPILTKSGPVLRGDLA